MTDSLKVNCFFNFTSYIIEGKILQDFIVYGIKWIPELQSNGDSANRDSGKSTKYFIYNTALKFEKKVKETKSNLIRELRHVGTKLFEHKRTSVG